MAELQNKFSWSVSARDDFEECRRRRYWAKYAMWNGWQSTATPEQRTAYRLTKMDNRFTLQGNAVEKSAMWLLDQARSGQPADAQAAYTGVAREYLNRCWSESRNRMWQADPKRRCCLHEHYYPEHNHRDEREMVDQVIGTVKTCLDNFITAILPELTRLPSQNDVPVSTKAGGDPESFMLDGIKIYAIPDYVVRDGDRLYVYDWKSGNPRAAHTDQLAVYGLWAHTRHKYAPECITLRLAYLKPGKLVESSMTAADLEAAAGMIAGSVADMTAYLENGDRAANRPIPREEWEMSADPQVCRRCNFYELCRPELEA